MADNQAPFIRLGDDAQNAPQLSYSIPEATAHVGTSVISIDIDEALLNTETIAAIRKNLEDKVPNRPTPTIRDLKLSTVKVVNRNDRVGAVANFAAASEVFEEFPGSFIFQPKEGMLGFSGGFDIIKPRPRPPERILPKILFFEKIQISSFLGNYGAGRVIKTHSLFPGEKTKISIKNYQKTVQKETSKVNSGSSILDSVTEEAAIDFENSIQSETSSKYTESEADILNSQKSYDKSEGGGEAKVLWGLVEAGGRGSSESSNETTGEWGTRSAREEFSNNVASALFKHSARASSKRDVEINTSSEQSSSTTSTEETEQVIEREIENVNVSRTLNLVFRQMVQEFISVVHLTDVKVALYDESAGPYPQFSIHELDKFLDAYFRDDETVRANIRQNIISELFFIFDHRNQPQQFLDVARLEFPQNNPDLLALGVPVPENISYLRVNKNLKTRLEDREFVEVQGVVLNANVITMRTAGVVVDGFLGKGGDPEAGLLDAYSASLQTETVREIFLRNNLQVAEAERQSLARAIVSDGDAHRARLFREVYCCDEEKCCKPSDEGGGSVEDTSRPPASPPPPSPSPVPPRGPGTPAGGGDDNP